MSNLPNGWKQATLAEVCKKIVDGSHIPPSAASSGFPMLSARNIQKRQLIFDDFRLISEKEFVREHARTNIEPGDVLITIVGAIGRTVVVPIGTQPFTLQRSVAVLKPVSMDSRFVSYILESPDRQKYLSENAKGTAQKGIYLQSLSQVQIPVPPLPEQKRIADKLDTLLARVGQCQTLLDRLPHLLKAFRQSVLAAATSGRLTEEWRENKGIKVDWEETDIQSVSFVGTGSTPLRSNPSFYAPKGTPWITSAATGQPFISDAKEFVTESAIKEHRLKIYPIGALIVAMYGEGKTRGQVSELAIETTINQACAAIVVDETKILKNYVKLALQANYLEMREMAEGGNQPNLNLSKIKELIVPLPSPEEQHEIVRRIERLFGFAERLETRWRAAQGQVSALTPSLLAKAFRGELV